MSDHCFSSASGCSAFSWRGCACTTARTFRCCSARAYTPLLVDVTYKRRIFEILLDLILTMFSYYAAYIIRFDREVGLYYRLFMQSLPIVIACQLPSFFLSGVYRGSWRYISLADLTTYAKAIALAVLSSVMVLVYVYRFEGYSRGVFVIDGMLLALLIVGSRLSFRVLGEAAGTSQAGAAGADLRSRRRRRPAAARVAQQSAL